jgi:hypothetical protein
MMKVIENMATHANDPEMKATLGVARWLVRHVVFARSNARSKGRYARYARAPIANVST